MKPSFRPILLAAPCWIAVCLMSATRNGLKRVANSSFSVQDAGEGDVATDGIFREARRRFPADRRVKVDSLARLSRILAPRKMQEAARELGDDATIIAITLQSWLPTLHHDRYGGPLTNPNFPAAPPPQLVDSASPRADWDAFLILARRGQHLEPDNTFFSWMRLYGLFATRRDDEGRAVLKLAARQTRYDDHLRDTISNRLNVVRLVTGDPLSPRDYRAAWSADDGQMFSKIRQTASWIVESAIADRSAARHTRALDAAFDLVKMGRVMRRQSPFVGINAVGGAVEGFAINRIHRPAYLRALTRFRVLPPLPLTAQKSAMFPTFPPRFGGPLAQLKASPFTLYSYARTQNRADITLFLDREWPELGQWRAWERAVEREGWMGITPRQTVILAASERFRALILCALPAVLLLGAMATLLSRPFRDDSGAPSGGFKRGVWAAVLLLPVALALDTIIALRQDRVFAPAQWLYLDGPGLLSTLPWWITCGPAVATLLLAMNLALGWQKRQARARIPLAGRVKALFAAPEDGLSRFDFGWMVGLVAKTTGWAAWGLLLLLFPALCFNLSSARGFFGFESATLGGALLIIAFSIPWCAHFYAWCKLPRRRMALRLALHHVSHALLGFLVAASVLYALIAFATLPLSFQYGRNFEQSMARGEVQIARAKPGL